MRGGINNLPDFTSTLIFDVKFQIFPVAAASMWFMPIYIIVLFGNQLIFYLINRLADKKNKAIVTYANILLTLIVIQNWGYSLLSNLDATILFYSLFLSLGVAYKITEIEITKSRFIKGMVIISIGIPLSSLIVKMPVNPMQGNKFPPNLTYMFFSFIIILLAACIKKLGMRDSKFLIHIGKNAIWYYFAQGIGSSLLYWILNYIDIELWFIKWFVCFLINFIISMIIAELLRITYYKIVIRLARYIIYYISGKRKGYEHEI